MLKKGTKYKSRQTGVVYVIDYVCTRTVAEQNQYWRDQYAAGKNRHCYQIVDDEQLVSYPLMFPEIEN